MDHLYCLLCTSIIASNEGYDADLIKTEIVPRRSIMAQYYRNYYTYIAGEYDAQNKQTVNGLTLDEYFNKIYKNIEIEYDRKYGADKFSSLPDVEQFMVIFIKNLLMKVIHEVESSMISKTYTAEDARKSSTLFIKDFRCKLYCLLDEFAIMNSIPSELWISLYNFAMDMPQVVIGLRKQVSSFNSTFFREHKAELDSLVPFMKSKKLKNARYDGNGLSIAGMIVGSFSKFYISSWFGEYAGTISAGSGVVVDGEGILQYGSELQEKMFSNKPITNIKDFERLMKDIDIASQIYEVGKEDIYDEVSGTYKTVPIRYFNLIKWRQNKIKATLIKRLENSTLNAKLNRLGLVIGGNLTESDISGSRGQATIDKKILFEKVDEWLTDIYNSNINSDIAQSMIDAWIDEGVKESERGNTKNGRYPLNFKYKGERFYNYNKQRLRCLIRGVQALKYLESEVIKMDYTFMSFPVYGYKNMPNSIITGVNLVNYLNQETAIDTSVHIVSDIEVKEDLADSNIIDNAQAKVNEVMRSIHKESNNIKITLGSLTDDELALTINNEGDRELIRYLRDNGISMQVTTDTLHKTVHDTIFSNFKLSMNKSWLKNVLTSDDFVQRIVDMRKGTTKDSTGCYLAQIRFLCYAISRFALCGKLTRGVSANASQYSDEFKVDPAGNFMCVHNFYNACKAQGADMKEKLNVFWSREISDEEYQFKESELFSRDCIQYLLCTSPYIGAHFENIARMLTSNGKPDSLYRFLMCTIPYIGKLSESGKAPADLLSDICSTLTNVLGRVYGCTMNVKDRYYLPRAICLGINIKIITEHLLAALDGIEDNILADMNSDRNTNAEDAVNVKLLLKRIKSLETLYSSYSGVDRYNRLKVYEDVYKGFLDSINFNIRKAGMYVNTKGFAFNKHSEREFPSFVFMDSISTLDSTIDDIDERLLQYSEVTKFLHVLLTNESMYGIELSGKTYSILQYVNILNDITTLDSKHLDEDYYVDRISIASIDEETQQQIDIRLKSFIEKNPEKYDIDESSTWLDNLKSYCDENGMRIPYNIINNINLNYERYSINEHQLITLDNKVVHTIIYHNNNVYKAVATRYGLFGFDGTLLAPLRKVVDFKWLLL